MSINSQFWKKKLARADLDQKQWEEMLFLSSVPLREIDNRNLPINAASGCLVELGKKRILITVQHATGNFGNWSIEIGYVPHKGTQIHQIGSMNFLYKITPEGGEHIDFSFAEIPDGIIALRQTFNTCGEIVEQKPINVFNLDFTITPRKNRKYGFAGLIKASREEHLGQYYLLSEMQIYQNLKYLESKNGMHYFLLDTKHPGHEEFEGCSGAPIIDQDQNVVALVCGGNITDNSIYGIDLSKLKIPIFAAITET